MRLVDADDQLLAEILEETEVHLSQAKADYTIYTGNHITLGRVVLVHGKGGEGTLVELE